MCFSTSCKWRFYSSFVCSPSCHYYPVLCFPGMITFHLTSLTLFHPYVDAQFSCRTRSNSRPRLWVMKCRGSTFYQADVRHVKTVTQPGRAVDIFADKKTLSVNPQSKTNMVYSATPTGRVPFMETQAVRTTISTRKHSGSTTLATRSGLFRSDRLGS